MNALMIGQVHKTVGQLGIVNFKVRAIITEVIGKSACIINWLLTGRARYLESGKSIADGTDELHMNHPTYLLCA